MSDFYEVDIKAEDCPIQMWDGNLTIEMSDVSINADLFNMLTGQNLYSVHKLSVGDEVHISHTDTTYKLGDKYGDSQLVCKKIFYKPRKWWQKLMFWKKKEIMEYIFKVVE